jgi:hypothetical protein
MVMYIEMKWLAKGPRACSGFGRGLAVKGFQTLIEDA